MNLTQVTEDFILKMAEEIAREQYSKALADPELKWHAEMCVVAYTKAEAQKLRDLRDVMPYLQELQAAHKVIDRTNTEHMLSLDQLITRLKDTLGVNTEKP